MPSNVLFRQQRMKIEENTNTSTSHTNPAHVMRRKGSVSMVHCLYTTHIDVLGKTNAIFEISAFPALDISDN